METLNKLPGTKMAMINRIKEIDTKLSLINIHIHTDRASSLMEERAKIQAKLELRYGKY